MSAYIRPALTLGAALSALALLAAPVLAQKPYDEEIVIIPPVYSEGTYSRGGGPNERVTAQVVVSTRDLNLRSDADVNILQRRISNGARLACDEVQREIPNMRMEDHFQCVRGARLGALREARLMVDYARG